MASVAQVTVAVGTVFVAMDARGDGTQGRRVSGIVLAS
jgi:hypothetical protein